MHCPSLLQSQVNAQAKLACTAGNSDDVSRSHNLYLNRFVVVQAPEHLDYFEVTVSLCDTLAQLYQKFMDDSCAAPHIVDALSVIDKKLKVRAACQRFFISRCWLCADASTPVVFVTSKRACAEPAFAAAVS